MSNHRQPIKQLTKYHYQMKTFSIGEVLEQGWQLFKKHWILSVILLGAGIATNTISSLFQPFDANDLREYMRHASSDPQERLTELLELYDTRAVLCSKLIYTIVNAIISVGLIRMVLQIIKGVCDELSFDAFNTKLSTYVKYIVVQFLVNLIIVIGTLLCIVPGIFFSIRLNFATYCLLDDPERGIIESIKMSWNMTRGNFWRIFGFHIVAIGIGILGLLCCCVGIFAALAWLFFAEALIYFALKPDLTTYETTAYNHDTTEYNKEESH